MIRHSKYKNTGLLFELLVRQITVDTMNDSNSPAITILKKYFVNTELGKEYRLYEQLGSYKNQTETKSEIIISSLLDASVKLNRTKVKKEKYNLIKEIRGKYDEEKFFKVKVGNYKVYAAFNNLIENQNNSNITPEDTIHNKITLLEHLIKPLPTKVTDALMEEYKEYPKDVKMLTHRILLEKFNEKYEHLLPEQKRVLREVVTSIDNTSKLRDYHNEKINEIKISLATKMKNTVDEVIKIKLQEVLKYIKPIEKTKTVSDENIINLLQYYELVSAL